MDSSRAPATIDSDQLADSKHEDHQIGMGSDRDQHQPESKIWRRSRAREQERNEPRATATTVPRSFAKIVGTNRVRQRETSQKAERITAPKSKRGGVVRSKALANVGQGKRHRTAPHHVF
ncbi:hypothetical protein NL676_032255 [Syzygium grande]|nr:hypothetical protein NL676_032255 [Syzygium grande]